MSKVLANLLGVDQRRFAATIDRLEHVCLQPGVDVRLTAEVITRSRDLARSIGLDPADINAREMYYGLLAYAEACDVHLRQKLGLSEKVSNGKAAGILAGKASKLLKKDKVVSLQPAAVRKLLSSVPPKKTLRLLKFRSISSVLKRENPKVLYALANRIEDRSWHTQVAARMRRLDARDVSEQSVEVLALPESWCDKLSRHSFEQAVQPIPEIGSVLLLPNLPLQTKGSVLLSLALALQDAQRLAIEALPFRARAFTTGLEATIPDLTGRRLHALEPVHGLQPSWQAVYRLLVDYGSHRLPDFDLVLTDLQWESTEMRLSVLHPSLDKWVDSHYLGFLTEEKPISLHVIDVAANLVLGRKYGEQILSHMRASIWNELQLRYLKQESLERAIIAQLTEEHEVVL